MRTAIQQSTVGGSLFDFQVRNFGRALFSGLGVPHFSVEGRKEVVLYQKMAGIVKNRAVAIFPAFFCANQTGTLVGKRFFVQEWVQFVRMPPFPRSLGKPLRAVDINYNFARTQKMFRAENEMPFFRPKSWLGPQRAHKLPRNPQC